MNPVATVKERLERSECITNVERGNESTVTEGEDSGVLFFRLKTDSTTNELEDFQPDTSTVVISSGEIVEFDVRLGSWKPENRKRELQNIQETAHQITRKHYVPVWRVDEGGGHGFVPHLRMVEGEAHPDAFVGFVEELTKEVEFLSNKG